MLWKPLVSLYGLTVIRDRTTFKVLRGNCIKKTESNNINKGNGNKLEVQALNHTATDGLMLTCRQLYEESMKLSALYTMSKLCPNVSLTV